MKILKVLFFLMIFLSALFFILKKTGKGCEVCIHGKKDGKHTGLCTLFIKRDNDKNKK